MCGGCVWWLCVAVWLSVVDVCGGCVLLSVVDVCGGCGWLGVVAV
jgi:hypothetical protein